MIYIRVKKLVYEILTIDTCKYIRSRILWDYNQIYKQINHNNAKK